MYLAVVFSNHFLPPPPSCPSVWLPAANLAADSLRDVRGMMAASAQFAALDLLFKLVAGIWADPRSRVKSSANALVRLPDPGGQGRRICHALRHLSALPIRTSLVFF
jgi:hypothetical protein